MKQANPGQATLLELYQIMLKIRLAELKIAEIYPTDKIQSPVHLSIGQEAVSAGVCRALLRTDHLYGTYRGHGVYIAKGGDLRKLFAELYAKDTGCARGKGGSMHLVALEAGMMGCSAIVASTIPLAAGDALAAKMKGEKRVAVAFFGDGAMDEGLFFETANFAALKNLPLIFVCENNNYAVHSRVADRHKDARLFRYAEPLGVPGERLDGLDVGVVYSTMCAAVQKVREGSGPLLLEYMTYRWHEHVGPGRDHAEQYRDKERMAYALAHDSIETAKTELISKLGVAKDTIDRIESTVRREVEEAVEFAERSPLPDATQLYDDVYEEKR